jgi:hypothetical protein
MKLDWGWRYFDIAIVILGVGVAIAVWFIPSFESNKDLQAYYKVQREIKAQNEAILAAEAAIKKEQEELGLVFLAPAPDPADRSAPKPKGKPKPKRDK